MVVIWLCYYCFLTCTIGQTFRMKNCMLTKLRSIGHQKNFLDFHVETQQFSSDDGGNDTASLSMTWEQCKYRLPTPNSTFHFKRSHFPPAPHNWRENLFSPPKLKTRNPTRSTFHSGGTFQHFVQKYSLLFFLVKVITGKWGRKFDDLICWNFFFLKLFITIL